MGDSVLGVTLTRGAYPMHSVIVVGLRLYALRTRPKRPRTCLESTIEGKDRVGILPDCYPV